MNMQPMTGLARTVVAQVAPGELPFFGAMSRIHAANPSQVATRRGGDEALAFGLAESAVLLTPVVLAAVSQIARYLAEEFMRSLAHMTTDAIAERIGKLLRHDPSVPPLTEAQLSRIHDIAIEVARAGAVPDTRAAQLADALVGRLVRPVPSPS